MITKLPLRTLALAAMLLSTLLYQPSTSHAQGTAFTYQGRLNNNGAPASGAYDLRFTVYDANAAGNVIAGPLTVSPVNVTNGSFTVQTDFGAGVFTGPARWLNIEVQPAGGGGFTPLTPRQEVTASPYAIRAASAGTAADVSAGSVVKSLNTLRDDVTLAAGANVTITPNGHTLTLAAAGAGGSGPWSVNGGNAYYSAGNVGIGTSSPTSKLAVQTGTGFYGFTHTDGAITLGSYVGGSASGAFGGWLGTQSDHPLHFFINNGQPSMTVDTSGNVGLGTTTPGSKLEVAGDTRINGRQRVNCSVAQYTTTTTRLQTGPGDQYPLVVAGSAGSIFVLIDLPSSAQLVMYGDAYKSSGGTSWYVASDRRLKQDVRAYEPGLNEVLQLRPVRFRYRDGIKPGLTSTHEEVGFIAQEVREVIPEAVTEGQDGYLSLKADPIHWAAINAIQALNQKVDEQRAENAELKQRLERLEQRMNQKSGGAN